MSKKRMAVFTIAQDEPVFLPIWSRFYRRYFAPDDIFVLDHGSQDLATVAAAHSCIRVPVHNTESFSHRWLREVVQDFQRFLLQSYEAVLFAEADEIVFPDPCVYPGGMSGFVFDNRHIQIMRCQGWELVHDRETEPSLDLSVGKTILSQRGWMRPSTLYSKPILCRTPVVWELGFHDLVDGAMLTQREPTFGLHLLHLHRMDYDLAWKKCQETAGRRWCQEDLDANRGYQNRFTDEGRFAYWFKNDFHDGQVRPLVQVPDVWREVI